MTVLRPKRFYFLTIYLLFSSISPVKAGGLESSKTNPVMILPFVLLLLSIALLPFISKRWWERFSTVVSLSLGAITACYYLLIAHNPGILVEIGSEYLSFILLIGSLYVVSSGIHINIVGRATPLKNSMLLGAGALMANIFGATGASILLIRPFMRINAYRLKGFHVVFFIFIVSNIGGALSPIGNPPIFLGYLLGVPFLWMFHNFWLQWIIILLTLLIIFYLFDLVSINRSRPTHYTAPSDNTAEQISVSGLFNIVFLCIILTSIFIERPIYLREILMIIAAAGSYLTTGKAIHKKNDFDFLPIKEVGVLFLGIFLTIAPVLTWFEMNARSIHISTPGGFYWATGILSSILDNAPTYLNFLSAATGLVLNDDILRQLQHLISTHGAAINSITGVYAEQIRVTYETLIKYHGDSVASGNITTEKISIAYLLANHTAYLGAISVGAVFFGAATYIGNVPNFIVKSIVENSGMKTPTFHDYVLRYSLPILFPIFILVWFLWFR
jgi:Na+/H+ antiporter NhaD/arsenite permease-like protein